MKAVLRNGDLRETRLDPVDTAGLACWSPDAEVYPGLNIYFRRLYSQEYLIPNLFGNPKPFPFQRHH
jgi:hypothetical protein